MKIKLGNCLLNFYVFLFFHSFSNENEINYEYAIDINFPKHWSDWTHLEQEYLGIFHRRSWKSNVKKNQKWINEYKLLYEHGINETKSQIVSE